LGSLPISLPDVKQSPSAVMSNWLENEAYIPSAFDVQDETELKDNLVEGGVIRIKGQEIQSDEFIAHLEAGKRVSKLAVEWDEHLRMVLCEDLSIKRIKLTDQLKEQMEQDSEEDAVAQFYADTVQMGLEFTRLMPSLCEAYGGIVVDET
ncbi:MAG: recombination-associated protein RdgC, partial [Pontibacterium sp.]